MNTQPLIDFMRNHYTTERLCALLAHAEEGKLAYHTCCCFIGAVNAPHPLATQDNYEAWDILHLLHARNLPGANAAEAAFFNLCDDSYSSKSPREINLERCANLIPLIRAELARREQLAEKQPEAVYADAD